MVQGVNSLRIGCVHDSLPLKTCWAKKDYPAKGVGGSIFAPKVLPSVYATPIFGLPPSWPEEPSPTRSGQFCRQTWFLMASPAYLSPSKSSEAEEGLLVMCSILPWLHEGLTRLVCIKIDQFFSNFYAFAIFYSFCLKLVALDPLMLQVRAITLQTAPRTASHIPLKESRESHRCQYLQGQQLQQQ